MYRLVAADQRPLLRDISELIRQEYPKVFSPLEKVRPHTTVLSPTVAARFLSVAGVKHPEETAWRFLKKLRTSFPPESFVPTRGECTLVDTFGQSLGIVLDAPLVGAEMETALNALSSYTGKPYHGYDRRPHVTLGDISAVQDLRQLDDVMTTAAFLCGQLLPHDRSLYLGPVTSGKPSNS